MKRRLFSLVLCAFGTLVVTPAAQTPPTEARSPRNANYTLNAALDTSTHTISGDGKIAWRNITKNPTSELRFHLYWNAWRDDHSSWIRETKLGRASAAGRPAADRGSIDLKSLTLGGQDLLAGAKFIAPDDGNADDRTVLQVPLSKPVAPGESIELNVAWTSHVPRPYARTGVQGNYYFIAQWFPKLGVLEDTGWNCHQFHAATEFFSDFGSYDVTLKLPDGWLVGATGREISPGRFVQDDVHDFAWTTSPDFMVANREFNEPGLPKVNMRLLLQKEHGDGEQVDRHFNATAIALRNYGKWFGPYPYEQITIVDPVTVFNDRAQGASTGGMEYPTLFTAGSRWKLLVHELRPESVTIHEAGHQFWYGIVATNEFEHAWMDEGFNTFSTARAISQDIDPQIATVERYFGGFLPWAYEDARWTREVDGDRLNAYRLVASFDDQSTPTWKYWPGSASAITYNKTALWLNTLEKMLGWETTQKILATYFQRWSFKHPAPQDFFAIANEVSGKDLTWFFDAVHRSSATFDYAVGQVTSDTVAIRRIGDGVFPVDIKVTFADGTSTLEHWNGSSRWNLMNLKGRAKIETVEVDPDRILLLDVNRTNNSWTAKPQTDLAVKRWTLRWITWAEELLMTYGFFS
ncbi:MAG: M1 family peptidase [Acidobacteria bacterium]|nr:MAG: M1 family peptidase [Acidobacteriota bacterium]